LILISPHPAKHHRHVCSSLLALVIAFSQTGHQKMPLESRLQEAQALLVAALISALEAPEHWYSPMLPANHPSNFCHLLGLDTEELHHVMQASSSSMEITTTSTFSMRWLAVGMCSQPVASTLASKGDKSSRQMDRCEQVRIFKYIWQ
jgi:hypothetical protein